MFSEITLFAIQTRIFIFLLQVFFNYMIPDHNAGVFYPDLEKPNHGLMDRFVSFLLDGLSRRWDGIYFLHIAHYGYTYINTYAFFPLFPFVTKVISLTSLLPFRLIIAEENILKLSGVLINCVAFVLSADILNKLSFKLTKNVRLAHRASVLYCLNPAGIFFSATYSESFFALTTFTGLLVLEDNKYFLASFFFALSSATRSNGTINACFVVYRLLVMFYKENIMKDDFRDHNLNDIIQLSNEIVTSKNNDNNNIDFKNIIDDQLIKKNKKMSHSKVDRITILKYKKSNSLFNILNYLNFSLIYNFIHLLMTVITSLLICILPFVLYQWYSYQVFCQNEYYYPLKNNVINYGRLNNYTMPGMFGNLKPKWCLNLLPLSYSYIQSEHWGLGLFSYYELKQIPNFLQAFPMLFICTYLIWSYFKGIFSLENSKNRIDGKLMTEEKNHSSININKENFNKNWSILFKIEYLPYIVYLSFLAIVALFYMHIQVITRLICSSCPIFYIFLAIKCAPINEQIVSLFKIPAKQDTESQFTEKDFKIPTKKDTESLFTENETILFEENILINDNVKNRFNKSDKGKFSLNENLNYDKNYPKLNNQTFINREVNIVDEQIKLYDDEIKPSNNKKRNDISILNKDYYDTFEISKQNTITQLTTLDQNISFDSVGNYIDDINDLDKWNESKFSQFVYIYFHLYFFIGTAAFSNFLPWT